jgi:processive 1,2-diacylglycerol beta-glucosyltransferase
MRPDSWRPSREVLTFLAVGGTGYVVDVLAFNWLRGQPGLTGHDPIVAKVLAVAVAMVVTYLGNRLVTWRDRAVDTARGREVALFIVFNLIGLGISVATLAVSHYLLGLTSSLADNLSANVLGLALGTAFRYWSYRRFVFAEAGPPVPHSVAAERSDRPLLGREAPKTVQIISGSYGAGHDAAAREIEVRLRAAGHVVRRADVVDLFPAGLGRLLRWAYFGQLRMSPRSWGFLLSHLKPGRWSYRVAIRLLSLAAPRIAELTAGDVDLVFSTHPFASQALGRLRATGRLAVPAVTYLTDASVHPLWVHPAVDLHLALHEDAARQARALGGNTTAVQALIPRACTAPPSETLGELRLRLGLPVEDDIALVVGGSHGVGDLEATAADVAASGLAHPVVLCGHNTRLRQRLEGRLGVVALGWRDDIPDLMRASDCVVQNAGGFTSLEALAIGVPVLSYRCLPGHGTANAVALERAGLVPWARSVAELTRLLGAALSSVATDLPVRTAAPDLLTVLAGAQSAVAS